MGEIHPFHLTFLQSAVGLQTNIECIKNGEQPFAWGAGTITTATLIYLIAFVLHILISSVKMRCCPDCI